MIVVGSICFRSSKNIQL